ncbi:type II secretion system protein GspJ, partial [Malonomonas rubra]|uniref:type II secretion system protein GspJ n=1 Tax=Malonomonas rubra TaxID=57040 RepID=UPI0026ED35F4
YGVFATSSSAKEQVEKQANALHLGRVLSARLNRELLGLTLTEQPGETILSGGLNSQNETFIELLTSSSGGPYPGMRRIGYRLAPDQDNRMTLWRSEKGENSPGKPTEEHLAQGISRLAFGFYDGTRWRNEWNSTSDGRPLLVRAEIELEDLGDRPPLISLFELPQPEERDGGQ